MTETLDTPPGYKAEALAVVAAHIPPDARVVEVGAGLGVVSEALVCRCAYLLACEPVPRLHLAAHERLIRAWAGDPAQAWVLVRAAVGPTGCADSVELHEMSEPWNSGAHVPFYDHPVRTFTATQVELSAMIRAARADTVVCDAEGAEVELLTGTDLAPLSTLMVEWHPHIVGAEAVAEAKEAVHRAGLHPAHQLTGELRPGGFAELVVYRRDR